MANANEMYHLHDEYYSLLKENTISQSKLQIQTKLATGQFGKVYKGEIYLLPTIAVIEKI